MSSANKTRRPKAEVPTEEVVQPVVEATVEIPETTSVVETPELVAPVVEPQEPETPEAEVPTEEPTSEPEEPEQTPEPTAKTKEEEHQANCQLLARFKYLRHYQGVATVEGKSIDDVIKDLEKKIQGGK